MLPRQRRVADANLRLHRPGTIDHHQPSRRRRRWLGLRRRACGRFAPASERALRAGKGLVGRHVADDGQDGVVRAEPGAVKGDEVVTSDAGDR
jgi:hypothetical protein